MKNSKPIKLSNYYVANNIYQEPDLKLWDGYLLRKINRVINKFKNKYWNTTHNFGVRVPKSVAQALQIDKDNGNGLW